MLEAIEIILFLVFVLGIPLILWIGVEREKRRLKRIGKDPAEYLARADGRPGGAG